ncbi:MAG TPA: universal stress protein [Caulobacteraceae bacterium]|nr:universal stress protein [Caulobacteraceae bacterium]
MGYATIMVQVQNEPPAEARLECALGLARSFGATLIGVGVESMRPLIFDNGMVAMEAEWFNALRDIAQNNIKAAKDTFAKATAGAGVEAIWEEGLDMPVQALARASRAADLVVAGYGPDNRNDPYRDAAPTDLALASGRPVLMVPQVAAPLEARRVLLAWKDTREARRAMSDAMPFLKKAEDVLVLEVGGREDLANAETRVASVVQALERHAVKARAKAMTCHEHETSGQIEKEARAFGADLLVAGAYGHSRLGEWVFGGVTQHLADRRDCYVLFSH